MQYLASDISLEGFSKVAGSTGDITDSDNLLVALAKLQNRTTSSSSTSVFARVPAQSGTLVYNGKPQEPVWSGYNENHVRRLSGSELKATNAGTYTVVFSLLDGVSWEDDGTIGDRMVQWTIEKAVINQIPSQAETLIYNGTDQIPVWNNFDTNQLESEKIAPMTDAATYTVNFTPKINYIWADGSTETKQIEWVIEKAKIDALPSPGDPLPYDGSEKSPTWKNYDPAQLEISGTFSATAVGTYIATFTPTSNFTWADGSTDSKEVTWGIEKVTVEVVAIPTANTTLYFTNKEQTPIWVDYDSKSVEIGGTTSASVIGTYVTTFTLKIDGVWADGSTDTKSITWKIEKMPLDIPSVTNTSFIYDEKAHVPTIGSYDENLILVTGVEEQTAEGEYKITFSLKDETHYRWIDGSTADKEITWKIGFEDFYAATNMLRSNPMRFGTDIFVLPTS